MDTTQEEWRQVIGYEGKYEVSNLGRVKSLKRTIIRSHGINQTIRERILAAYLDKKRIRYFHVVLCDDDHGHHTRCVHKLVAEAFIGPCPKGKEARHLDGNKDNNTTSNLVYGTPIENQADRIRHGTSNRGERHGLSKLTNEDIENVFTLRKEGLFQHEIASQLGVRQQCISRVLSGKRWGHSTQAYRGEL